MPGQSPGMLVGGVMRMDKADPAAVGKGFAGVRDRGGGPADIPNAMKDKKGLDSQLWHACAGGMVQLPPVGAKVIYFPQGHGEQAASPPEYPRNLGPSGSIPCRIISVNFLADAETDEVYAKIRLQPENPFGIGNGQEEDEPPSPPAVEKPASFAKTLTQSDANNGGGFSVPRYCAETIFPRLDYSVDPPVQTVLAKDVHGEVWKFRHIYRGTPRRHLLTTGWSTFVNQKKLVAGDAIVFLRSASGELCVGVRRSMRTAGGSDSVSWHSSNQSGLPPQRPSRWELKSPDGSYSELLHADGTLGLNGNGRSSGAGSGSSNFARNRARVTSKSVFEAANLASMGQPFEVVYYPRASTAEFCVKAATVRGSIEHSWYPGMRFKMAFETEDSSRISWFMGTISAVQPADPIRWPTSPWRILQVTWDEPDLLQGVNRVSPWQVELVSTLPMQLPPFSLPKKKFRASQPLELQLAEGHGFMGLPMATLANSLLGQMNPWQGLSNDIPAGMQGARHERYYGFTLSDCQPKSYQAGMYLDSLYPMERTSVVNHNAADLKLGNFLQHDSIGVQGSHPNFTILTGNPQITTNNIGQNRWTGSTNNKSSTFLLFGKAIDPNSITKGQQQQSSGGSSSEGTSCQQVKESSPLMQLSVNSSFEDSHSDSQEKVHKNSPNSRKRCVDLRLCQGDSSESDLTNEIGSMKWMKEQASMLNSERKDVLDKETGDGLIHCKIFMESEEVGRTLDLSLFTTYEELYNQLSSMFNIEKTKLSGRVVYKDLEGSTIHIGGEPYRNFMTSVRRLTILSIPNGLSSQSW